MSRLELILSHWLLTLELLFNRQSAALATLERMLSHWPNDARALASRAHLRATQSQWALASQDLALLCERVPGAAAHWFNRGYVLEQLQRTTEAEACFRQALDLDPSLDRAWYGLGMALIQQSRLEEALAALRRNTELQPMSPHGWVQLARVHDMRQESEQVAAIIRHLRGFEPRVAAQLAQQTGLKA